MYNPFDESSQFPGAGSFQKSWSWFTARFAGAGRLLLAHRWMAGVPVALFSLHSLMALPVLVIQNGAMASHFRNVGGINWAGEVFAEFIPKWLGSSLRLALSDMSLGVLAPYVQHFLPSLLVLFFVGPMLKWLIEQSGSLEDRALTALRLAWRAAQAILLLLVVVAMGAIASSRMLKAFLQGAPQALHGAAVLVQTAGGALYLAALGIVVRREPLSLGRLLNAAVSCYLELLPIIVLLYLFSNPVPDMVVRLAIRSPFPAARTLSMAIWTLPYAIPLIMIPLVLISAA